MCGTCSNHEIIFYTCLKKSLEVPTFFFFILKLKKRRKSLDPLKKVESVKKKLSRFFCFFFNILYIYLFNFCDICHIFFKTFDIFFKNVRDFLDFEI